MKVVLRLAGVSALVFALFGATQALAAPGGGTIKGSGPCAITVGEFGQYGDAVGYSTYMLTPSGKERITCTALLVDLTLAPLETVSFTLGGCDYTVYPTGLVYCRC